MRHLRHLGCAALLGSCLSACAVRAGVAVTVPHDHVHTIGCGHYWHGGQWFYVAGHVHTHECGHIWFGERWIVGVHTPAVVIAGHVHGHGCGHYWHGGRWFEVEPGHVHVHGCGHVWDGGRWVVGVHKPSIVVADHVHGPNCGHYQHDGRWFDVEHGHVHNHGCGHVRRGRTWVASDDRLTIRKGYVVTHEGAGGRKLQAGKVENEEGTKKGVRVGDNSRDKKAVQK